MINIKWLILTLLFPVVTPIMRRPAEKDMQASVLLHIKFKIKGKAEYTECSGTYIASNTILSAAHCFPDTSNQTWARGPNESLGYPVHLVALDKSKDLALLMTPIKHPHIKIGPLPKRGDYVLNIGSPLAFEFVPSEGVIGMVSFTYPGLGGYYLVTTAMANPGSSGGGAFDRKGRLIGVNTMTVGMFGWTGLTMAVNSDTIRLFLREAEKLINLKGENDA